MVDSSSNSDPSSARQSAVTEQKQSYGWPTKTKDKDGKPLPMPEYFIQTGDGPHDWILNLGAFDFEANAGGEAKWFKGERDPSSSERMPIPEISSELAQFDLFDLKMMKLVKRYSNVLVPYYPCGMNSSCKRDFAAAIASHFGLMEVKYQDLMLKHRQGTFIGKKVKKNTFRWPSVVVSSYYEFT